MKINVWAETESLYSECLCVFTDHCGMRTGLSKFQCRTLSKQALLGVNDTLPFPWKSTGKKIRFTSKQALWILNYISTVIKKCENYTEKKLRDASLCSIWKGSLMIILCVFFKAKLCLGFLCVKLKWKRI